MITPIPTLPLKGVMEMISDDGAFDTNILFVNPVTESFFKKTKSKRFLLKLFYGNAI